MPTRDVPDTTALSIQERIRDMQAPDLMRIEGPFFGLDESNLPALEAFLNDHDETPCSRYSLELRNGYLLVECLDTTTPTQKED